MNMKAIVFAGMGLFLSMGVTSWFIAQDVQDIRERTRAAQVAECSTSGAQAPAAATTPGATTIDPLTGLPTTPPPTQEPDAASACPGAPPAGSGVATEPAAINPMTGAAPAAAPVAEPDVYGAVQPYPAAPAPVEATDGASGSAMPM